MKKTNAVKSYDCWSAEIFCTHRAPSPRAMLNIAEALASHTSHALPLTCGATQTSPPYLSQRPHSRAGRQPTVPLTCRRRQNRKTSSARTCERPYDEARNIAKAACSHRVHVRLLARAPAPSSPLQPGWGTCEARRLTNKCTGNAMGVRAVLSRTHCVDPVGPVGPH